MEEYNQRGAAAQRDLQNPNDEEEIARYLLPVSNARAEPEGNSWL